MLLEKGRSNAATITNSSSGRKSEREARNLKCFVNYNARGTSSRCDNRKRGGLQ
jgi:hypothetical protein